MNPPRKVQAKRPHSAQTGGVVRRAARLVLRVVAAALCFGPSVLVLLGLGPEIEGPLRNTNWGLQAILTVWWGRLLVAAVWLGLGWLVYRALFRSGQNAA